ncbi:MAG TPA: hypothetical protein DDZ53_04010, partial [Firmicutes bacterium]|nr:hypothetical protein [Bacillota bacterium]
SLTRFNGTQFWLNAELIETVEATPDVIITLTNGRKYDVREKAEQVVAAVLEYRNRSLLEAREEAPHGF